MKTKLILSSLLLLAILIIYILLAFKSETNSIQVENGLLKVEAIRKMNEIVTAEYYGEVLTDSIKKAFINPSILVILSRIRVQLGLGLDSLVVVAINDTEIRLRLKKAKILRIIMNPYFESNLNMPGFEIIKEQGHFTEAEIKAVKEKAKKEIVKEMTKLNVLERAQANAEKFLQGILKMNYETVLFEWID